MRTFPLARDRVLFAVEVENLLVSPRELAAILRGVDGVSNTEMRLPFSSPGDVHVRFQYRNIAYIVWEPYGDSSRYWIGPADDMNKNCDISPIIQALDRYKPRPWRRLMGKFLLHGS